MTFLKRYCIDVCLVWITHILHIIYVYTQLMGEKSKIYTVVNAYKCMLLTHKLLDKKFFPTPFQHHLKCRIHVCKTSTHLNLGWKCCCSVTVMSDFLWPHEMQPTRLPCPSPSPRVCSNSCPLSQWWYLTISSSATLFSFCLQSFPASGSFPMSQLCIRWPKYWSFSFSISPSNEYSGLISFRIVWFDLFAVQGTLKSLLQLEISRYNLAFLAWMSFPTPQGACL